MAVKKWTLLVDSENGIQVFEIKCLRKLVRISYLEHKVNDWVRNEINSLMVSQDPLMTTVKRQKLAWFEHVTSHNSLSKAILQARLQEEI